MGKTCIRLAIQASLCSAAYSSHESAIPLFARDWPVPGRVRANWLLLLLLSLQPRISHTATNTNTNTSILTTYRTPPSPWARKQSSSEQQAVLASHVSVLASFSARAVQAGAASTSVAILITTLHPSSIPPPQAEPGPHRPRPLRCRPLCHRRRRRPLAVCLPSPGCSVRGQLSADVIDCAPPSINSSSVLTAHTKDNDGLATALKDADIVVIPAGVPRKVRQGVPWRLEKQHIDLTGFSSTARHDPR